MATAFELDQVECAQNHVKHYVGIVKIEKH